jgi:hypothetical protein
MYHFKLTALCLVIFISTITTINAQNNTSSANTAGNTNANASVNAIANTNANANANKIVNTNTNTNANANVNVNANANVNSNANSNTNTNTNSAKAPTPDARLQIVFSGVDPSEKDNTVLKVKDVNNEAQKYTFLAKDAETKAVLTKFKEGDIVSVKYADDKESKILKDISVVAQQLNRFWHYIFPVLIFAALIVVSWLLLRPRAKDLIVGQDNRYSKSKVQIAAWFFVLIASYIAVFIIRLYYSEGSLIGGIGIPTNLLLLSGLSAFTFAAAKGITQGNVEAAGGVAKPKAAKPRLVDLFQDDEGRIDLADFQMMVVVFLAVMTYVIQIFGFLGTVELYQSVSLPDVDTTILATFGLGQGAYLIKKAVSERPPNQEQRAKILTEGNENIPPTAPQGGN